MLKQLKDSDGGVWEGRLRASDLTRIEEMVKIVIDPKAKTEVGMNLTDPNLMQHFYLNPQCRREILIAWLFKEWSAKGLTQEQFADRWEPEAVSEAMDFLDARVNAFLFPVAQRVRAQMIAGMMEQMAQPRTLAHVFAAIGESGSTASPESSSSAETPTN